MPAYIAAAQELDFDRNMFRRLPAAEPLVPLGQLRALVGDLISAPVPGDPDIHRIVDALAEGRLPAVLPRITRKGVASRLHLLIDSADSMRLFDGDAHALLRAVHAVAGPAVESERAVHGPPPSQALAHIVRGDTIIIISDLGIGSPVLLRRLRIAAWRDFAATQRLRGVNLTGIVPFHRQKWPSSLKARIRLLHWHRPGTVSKLAHYEDLRRLALVLSPAAVIDPALLRRARRLMLPAADAGVEADFANQLWTAVFNPRVIAFAPAWTIRLRSELALDSALMNVALGLLQRPSTPDWLCVAFEEEIVHASMQDDPTTPHMLQDALARVIHSLLGGMRTPDMARWALCMLDELPLEAQQAESARLLKAVALIILNAPDDEVAKIVTDYDARWVFGEMKEVGVLWDGNFVVVREPAQISDRIVKVPDTRPHVVIVEDRQSNSRKVLRIFPNDDPPAWVVAKTLPLRIKGIDGSEYEIDGFAEMWQTLLRAFGERQSMTGIVRRYSERYAAYIVDIGFDALLPEKSALMAHANPDDLIGSTILVKITKIVQRLREITVSISGDAELSFSDATWEDIRARFYAAETIAGTVAAWGRRGWAIEIAGVPAFVTGDELPEADVQSVEELTGETLQFAIRDIDEEKREVHLSRFIEELAKWKALLNANREKSSISGRVIGRVKGGLSVTVNGVKAFLPSSLIDTRPVRNLDSLKDNEYEFKIESLDLKKRNVVVSRRAIVEAEEAAAKADTLSRLVEGQPARGVVKNITDYGVFIDLGGVDGLLHITDISWGRVIHPSEYFAVGDHVEVVVLKLDPRVSLGYKQKRPDPWVDLEQRYPLHSLVHGRVIATVDYGAFIELEEGVEGLIHISEMSWTKKIRNPSKAFSLGTRVDAVVTDVNVEKRRISLSLKALEPNPWDTIADRYPIGALVTGKVRNLTDFGAFVQVEDGIDGMIHISDISWNRRLKHPNEVLKKGDTVQARVINVDGKTQRLSLSIKELLPNSWEKFVELHKVGDELSGIVAGIAEFGLFIRLADGVEGLAHISEIPRETSVPLSALFEEGQSVRARIIKIDREERKLGFTLRD
jgi:small subunit ribosomal protein S1